MYLASSAAEAALSPEYLTAKQVSELTGFSVKALEAMRSRGTGPRAFKTNNRVRYRLDTVRSWMEANPIN